jgi:hypothetical protein
MKNDILKNSLYHDHVSYVGIVKNKIECNMKNGKIKDDI